MPVNCFVARNLSAAHLVNVSLVYCLVLSIVCIKLQSANLYLRVCYARYALSLGSIQLLHPSLSISNLHLLSYCLPFQQSFTKGIALCSMLFWQF